MDPVIFIPIAILLIGGAFVVGIIRNRNFNRKEKLHHKLAQQLNLSISYLSEKDFTLYGNYRDYRMRVEGLYLFDLEKKHAIPVVKASVPMINPQLKVLRIAKSNPDYPQMDQLAFLDRPVGMPHDLGEWLTITTNDLMFGSVLLSDDIKISLFESFNPAEAAVLYIEGEEMAFVAPQLVLDEDAITYYQKAIDLMCDIKDDLNN